MERQEESPEVGEIAAETGRNDPENLFRLFTDREHARELLEFFKSLFI